MRTTTATIFLLLIFGVASAFAGELKVVDQMGLTRAVRAIDGEATVVVVIPPQPVGPRITLSNVDGIAPDQSGVPNSQGEVSFSGVAEGSWQVKVPKGVEVQQVHINPIH